MPRFSATTSVYQVFQDFLDRCILHDQSLLLPNYNAWTAVNAEDVRKRLIDNPQLQDQSFEDKLLLQMREASPEEWLILADIHYIYYLPSLAIKPETKRKRIEWLLEQGRLPVPSENDSIWVALYDGYLRTGQRYHLRYLQLWLIIKFAAYLKNNAKPDQILADDEKVKRLLDELLEDISARVDRAYDMRHAILYMAYPDKYEPIISSDDKKQIIATFAPEVGGVLPTDPDHALQQIRKFLSPKYDQNGQPFNFYQQPVNYWRHKSTPKINESSNPEVSLPDPDANMPEDANSVLSVLKRTRNVILYGPPGTGKTFIAQKVASKLVEKQVSKPLSESARIQTAVEGLTIYEILALSMYIAGPNQTYSVNDLMQQKVLQGRTSLFEIPSTRQVLWTQLGSHVHESSKTVKMSHRTPPFLFDKDSESRWFLTVEGQDFVKEKLGDQIKLLSIQQETTSPDRFIERVTFHQSFAYEDFVEGWRPETKEDGDISYRVTPGILRRIAERAEADSDNNYVLLIDEINRGNIAKILGELITLLEDDKRKGQKNAITLTLPYSGHTFGLPSNLYIIATMNTADRSIALLDVALRRRFGFVEIMPRPELLHATTVSTEIRSINLEALLAKLNQRISQYLDRDYQIGHSYLLRVNDVPQADQLGELEYIWNSQILSLLQEYFYSQRDTLTQLLDAYLSSFDRLLCSANL